MADDLQLAFCIDDRFAPHLAVCLHSIQTHLGHGMAARAHIIGDLSPDVARRLGSMAGDRLDLAFHVRVPDFSHLHISPTFASRLSIATYHRLALPELLPGRDRILYLDADMLALTDLTPLWETDLHGCAAAVVQDYFLGTEKRWERLGLPHPEYFNAGMMLMDLDRWRKEKLAACVAEAVAEMAVVDNELKVLETTLRARDARHSPCSRFSAWVSSSATSLRLSMLRLA